MGTGCPALALQFVECNPREAKRRVGHLSVTAYKFSRLGTSN